MKPVAKTEISVYPLLARGKVRDIYEVDERTLLIVTTDRMSAFDVVLSEIVPYKGVILNQMTLFWMRRFDRIVPNHVLEWNVDAFPAELAPWREELDGRSALVRKAAPLPVECIARGYLAGSGWQSYQKSGTVCGHELPPGLKLAQELPAPIFTPSTKAVGGKHDENISYAQCAALLGDEAASRVRLLTLDLYAKGAGYAAEKGIIVADTKFEFGYINGVLHIIDEVLTPDSSRFWPKAGYEAGKPQPSFDKQYLRDWLNGQDWDKKPPAPKVPESVIRATASRYKEAYEKILGKSFPAE